MSRFPAMLWIAGSRWRCAKVLSRNSVFKGGFCGHCDFQKKRIYVSKDLDADSEAQTLLHEALHPICTASGIDLSDKAQEDEHDRFATQLFAWLRDERNWPALDYICGRGLNAKRSRE